MQRIVSTFGILIVAVFLIWTLTASSSEKPTCHVRYKPGVKVVKEIRKQMDLGCTSVAVDFADGCENCEHTWHD